MIPSFNNVVGRSQGLAIAVVLALGAIGAAALLRGGPAHDDGEHAHAPAESKTAPAAAASAPAHDDDGLVAMSDAQIRAAGIVLDTAAPGRVRSVLQLPGEIGFDEDRTAHIVPRVSGVVEAVPVALGQRVAAGQRLAVISSPAVSDLRAELQAAQQRVQLARKTHEREQQLFAQRISPEQDVQQAEQALREAEIAVANARQKLQALGAAADAGALNRYELRAPFAGVIVAKHITLGEQVREDANVFTVSDLGSVWAQLHVPASQLPAVRVGERVTVRATAFAQSAQGRVAHVGALIGEQTRTAQARVTLGNPDGAWRPGLFVNVELAAGEADAPVTVASEALQTLEGRQVVFVRTPAGFRATPVQVGRSDARRSEITAGLAAGARVAAAGSFVVKSEAGKAAATHEH